MFDPYHKWLGIPPDQRPPSHYQLLGISPTEKDREVIREAGIRQTAHLRTYQTGPQAAECTKLLNEVALAQTVLLDPAKRKDYDAKLAKTAITSKPKASAAPPQRRPLVKAPVEKPTHPKSSALVGALLAGAILLFAGGAVAFIYYKESHKLVEPPVVVDGNKDQPSSRDKDGGEVRPVPSSEPELVYPPRLVVVVVDPKKNPLTYVKAGPRPDPGPELIYPPKLVVVKPPPPPDPKKNPLTYVKKDPPVRPPDPTPGVKKLPVPSTDEQKKAEKLIRALAKLDQVKRQPAEMVAAAQHLIDKGKETKDDPAARFMAFRLARDLALQAFEPTKALEAITELGKDYAIDEIDMKVSALESLTRAVVKATAGELGQAAIPVLDEAIAGDHFAAAQRLHKSIAPVIQIAGSRPLYDQLQARIKMIDLLTKEHEKVRQAEEALQKNPADPAANRIVGAYLCFGKGNWKKGLPHLIQSGDPRLKELAKLDLSSPTKAADLVALGDGWFDVAKAQSEQTRTQLHKRAYHWYTMIGSDLTGLTHDRVLKQVGELEKLLGFATALSGAKLVPVPLDRYATVSSARSMFTGDPNQVMIFPKWGLQQYFDIPFALGDPKDGKAKNFIVLRSDGSGAENGLAKSLPLSVKMSCAGPIKTVHLISGPSGWGYPNTSEKSVSMVLRLHFQDGSEPEEHKLRNAVHFANPEIQAVEGGFKALPLQLSFCPRHIPISVKRPFAAVKEIEFAKGEDNTAPVIMAVTVERPN